MITKNIFNLNNEHEFDISQDDVPLFLDIFPFPCIIINTKSKVILTMNGFMTELTNYGRQELIGLEIFSLLEQFPKEKVTDGKKYEGLIKVKGKSALPVFYELFYLSQRKNIALIKIENESFNGNKKVATEQKIVESLNRINQMTFAGEEKSFYKGILVEIIGLFNVLNAYIYLYDDQEKILKIMENDDGIFPDRIPGIELERIKKIDYWCPGRRVLTEVHRIGRKKGYTNVITVPLGNKPIGLLVIVSDKELIKTNWQREFELFISWIDEFLDNLNLLNENKEENNRLLKRNLILTNIFEQSNDCFVLIDAKYKIILLNEQFQKLLKYSTYEMIGQNILDVIHTNKVKEIIEQEIKDPVVEISPLNIHDRNGNSIPVKMKIITSDDFKLGHQIIIISNISKEINFQKTIEKIRDQAALGEVIADFAHEVRNPINNLSTGLQLMRKKLEGEAPSLEIIDRLQSDCVRMNDLMESVLSFSRQSISNFQPFDCHELLIRINNRFSSKKHMYKITSELICNTKNTTIFGDNRSIDQVFTNLINNAVDAMMETGGELTIKINNCQDKDGFLLVTISDTGLGIPEELKGKIFDPFITGKEKGTGLGLAISKKIVEAHDGSISVDSFTNGTIFTVLLKLADEEINK